MKARLISVLLVLALLVTVGVIAAQAAEATYECGCDAENVVEINNATFADGASLTAGSYKLTEKLTTTLVITEGTVCVDLNGYDIEVTDGLAIDVQGGELHLTAGDSTISGGNTGTDKAASTVYIPADVTVKLYGGEYVRGAGNQAVINTASPLTLYDVTAVGSSDLVDIQHTLELYITDCELGYVKYEGSDTRYITLAGVTKISHWKQLKGSGKSAKVNVSTLKDGSMIITDWTSDSAISYGLTNAVAEQQLKYYFNTDAAKDAYVNSGIKFAVKTKDTHKCRVCKAHKTWEVLTDSTTISDGGHYYLTENLTLSAAIEAVGKVCVDLNGKNITNESGLVFNVPSSTTLNVFNSKYIESVVTGGNAPAADAADGTIVGATINNAGTLKLNGGTYTHTAQVTGDYDKPTVATVYAAGTTTMDSFTKITVADDVKGYNVYNASGTFTMNGGEISNATNAAAGNVWINDGTFNMYDGVIKDGTATASTKDIRQTAGGNIRKYGGKLYIYGGTVSGGTARGGGNIYSRLGVVSVTGGIVEDGTAVDRGGNVYLNNVSENCEFTNCVIRNGSAPIVGGNLYIATSTKTVTIGSGAQFLNGEATGTGEDEGLGGNVYIANGNVDVAAGATISGGSAKIGGNIYNVSSKTVTIAGTVKDGTATTYGGNIYNTGTLTVSGTVKDGTATTSGYGGNIYNTGTLTVSGTISGGDAEYGGSIYTSGANADITVEGESATIDGGTSDSHGGNVYVNRGNFTLNSGTLKNGVSTGGDGSCIYVRSGNVNLLGGKVISNVTTEVAALRQGSVVLAATATKEKTEIDGEQVEVIKSYTTPILTIGGDFEIESQIDREGIWLNDYSQMIVNAGFSGSVKLRTIADFVPAYGSQYGLNLRTAEGYTPTLVASATGSYTGSITLPQCDNAPALYAGDNEGLLVANVKVDDTWYTAQGAYETGEDDFQLLGDATLTLADAAYVTVDLNGHDVNVTVAEAGNTATFNGYNTNANAASTVTLGEGVSLANTDVATWNTDHFDVVLGANSEYTIHRVNVKMKSVSVRPGTESVDMYYTTEVVTDPDLKTDNMEFGILLGLEDTKGNMVSNEVTKDDLLAFDYEMIGTAGYGFVGAPGNLLEKEELNSALVKGILKKSLANDENAARADIVLHAVPYIAFSDEKVVALATDEAKSYSVYTFLSTAEEKFDALDDNTKQLLRNFYDGWDYMKDYYKLPNISTYPAPSEETT